MARDVCCYKELLNQYRESLLDYYAKGDGFDDLKPYDVVWCLMPLSTEPFFLSQNHQTRPYVIIEKGVDSFLGYPFTTSFKSRYKNKYVIIKDTYCNKKDTAIILDEMVEIPKTNSKDRLFTLNDNDIKEIKRKINIIQNKYTQTELDVGDIIFDKETDEKYYIYDANDCHAYGYIINKIQEGKIKIYDSSYDIDLSKQKEFLQGCLFNILEITTIEEQKKINEIISPKVEKVMNIAQIGDLIEKDNYLYYVYAADHLMTCCFQVYEQQVVEEIIIDEQENEEKIIINEKSYYFELEQIIQIERDCLHQILDKANTQEIIYNQKAKENKKRLMREKRKQELKELKKGLIKNKQSHLIEKKSNKSKIKEKLYNH